GEPFVVCGTHLPLLKDPVWRLRPSLRAALPDVATPAAFAGDMNMWGWCIDRLVPRGWRRVVRGRTYPAHRPHSQTDHVLVTPPVEAVEAEAGPQAMSEHRPVRTRLRFGPRRLAACRMRPGPVLPCRPVPSRPRPERVDVPA